MSSMALYEIRELRDVLDEAIYEAGGEISPEVEAQLAALDANADEKIERVALWIREQHSTAEAIEAEAKRLQARAAAKLNAARSLKGYLEREMARLGKDKVNGLYATVALQNNPPAVVGNPTEETLRSWKAASSPFVTYRETYTLDKKAVLEAKKHGYPLPEGLEVTQSRSIRIR